MALTTIRRNNENVTDLFQVLSPPEQSQQPQEQTTSWLWRLLSSTMTTTLSSQRRLLQQGAGDMESSTPALTCGGDPIRYEITMPKETEQHCGNYCKREYLLYFPTTVCQASSEQVDSLPMLFAIHCLGCNTKTMSYMKEYAELYSMVLVVPEGIESSFNAQYCCGTALEQNVDDKGFFEHLILDLSQKHSHIVKPTLVYGMGWSNGGYMVNYAASLFNAIAPISGYQIDLDETLQEKPTPIFLHHSEDDHFVRYTGCCTDTTMPTCCCHISEQGPDQCTSVPDKMKEWGYDINGCTKKGDDESEEPLPILTRQTDEYSCYSYEKCQANTTYCSYKNKGHFNKGGFANSFPMSEEIVDFFARDACEQQGNGIWSTVDRTCTCNKQQGQDELSNNDNKSKRTTKTYCHHIPHEVFLDDDPTIELAAEEWKTERWLAPMVLSLVVLVAFYQYCWKRIFGTSSNGGGGSSSGNQRYDKVPTVELTESTVMPSVKSAYI